MKILESSIAEDFNLRHVFEDFLKVAEDGIVDSTRESLARKFNIPLEMLNENITKLESPDPKSRDEEFEGRRIERLDDHRDWGWRILNWGKWESLRTRADLAIRQARHRKKSGKNVNSENNTDVEPHDSFPRTKEDAVAHSDFVGCTKEFAETTWNKAMSRSGRDSKGQVIRSWRHFLASEHAYHKGRPDINGNQKRSPEWDKTIRDP